MSVFGNLLSGVIVNGVRPAIQNTISGGIGSAVGSALSGSLSNLGASTAAKALSKTPPPLAPGETQVQGVDVTAPSSVGSLGSSIVPSALSSALGAGLQAAGASYSGNPPPALANITPANDQVSGLDITAVVPPPAYSSLSDIQLPANVLGNVADLTKTENDPLHNGSISKENGFKEAAAGAGLLAALGLDAKSLAGLGLLAGGLAGGGGKTADTSGPTQGLQDIATNNQQLASQLQQRALAGMSGDIGGKGMNYISRMVRHAQAAIRQRYAGMNMSGSTAENDDLNAAAQSGVDMQFKIGQENASQGLQTIAALTGQSAQAYISLLNAATAKNTTLGNALANFAGAAAGRLMGTG